MYSLTTTNGDGVNVAFTIPFKFQSQSELSVEVGGVPASIDYVSGGVVYLTEPPAAGLLVQIKRTTDLSERAVDFASTAHLKETDLDNSNLQVFYALQEAYDRASQSIALSSDNTYDAQGQRISDVGHPVEPSDAVTKDYVDNAPNSAKDAAEAAAAEAQAAADKLGNATVRVVDIAYGLTGYGDYNSATGVMTLYVPAGPTGATGDTGPTGAQGLQGLQGVQGVQGPEGEKGQRGDKGEQGEQGIQGLVGAQGPDGAQGPLGPTALGLAFGRFVIDPTTGMLQCQYHGTTSDNDFTINANGELEVTY